MFAHSGNGKLVSEKREGLNRFAQGFVCCAAKKGLAQGAEDNFYRRHFGGFSLVNVADGFVGLEKGHDTKLRAAGPERNGEIGPLTWGRNPQGEGSNETAP